jgi:hypothetical protein
MRKVGKGGEEVEMITRHQIKRGLPVLSGVCQKRLRVQSSSVSLFFVRKEVERNIP